MRKTVIYCDKCGAEIVGTPIQIIPEYSDRDDGSYEPYLGDGEVLPLWIRRMLSKEFCEKCAKETFDFALNNADADANEKEPDQKDTGSDPEEVDWDIAIERIKATNQLDGTQCPDEALCQNRSSPIKHKCTGNHQYHQSEYNNLTLPSHFLNKHLHWLKGFHLLKKNQ